jgi:hypothetical protein
MSCGAIPGPKGPKDLHSFLVPFDDELAQLAVGIDTYNSLTRTRFDLRAYNISGHGDIIAVEKMMNIKGHNSLSGCRGCKIKGQRNVDAETIYYYPLAAPRDGNQQPASWEPRELPFRTHARFMEIIGLIDDCRAKSANAAEQQAKFYGIKGLPALRRVGSMDLARSYPWDLMHLLFENIIPNLIALWSGKYKGLDTGNEDYEIPDEVWDEIWREMAEAMKDIPSEFSRSLAGGPGNLPLKRGASGLYTWPRLFSKVAFPTPSIIPMLAICRRLSRNACNLSSPPLSSTSLRTTLLIGFKLTSGIFCVPCS